MFCLTYAIVGSIFLVAKDAIAEENFCDVSLCPVNTPHVGCKQETSFGHRCPKEALLFGMNRRIRNIILKEHNRYRNQLARGNLNGLPVASNMLAMEWDDTLEYLAELNVKQCKLKNSKCFATSEFKTPGQNIAFSRFRDDQSPRQNIKAHIKMWFDEYLQADIESLITGKTEKNLEIAHFLQIARDNASQIGCAISLYDKESCHFQLMTCFYSDSFQPGQATYQMGHSPGDKCENGAHATYGNLCVSGADVVATRPPPKDDAKSKDKNIIGNIVDWIKVQNNSNNDISIEIEHKQINKSNSSQFNIEIGNHDPAKRRRAG